MKIKLNFINILIYLYLLLKPFYLNESGTLQLSDIIIIIAFFLILLKSPKIESNINLKLFKDYNILLIFVICIFFINIIGYLKYFTYDFLLSILYFVFILMGLYVFIYKITDRNFLNIIYRISIFNVIEQVFIFILGFGKYYSFGRYMGTFNDPNQFGFFIVLMLMYIYTLKNILNKDSKFFIMTFILGAFMIFESASTGMILAIISFVFIQFLINIKNAIKINKKHSRKVLFIFFVLIIFLIYLIIRYNTDKEFKNNVNIFLNKNIFSSSIYTRILGKVDKMEASLIDILEDRHLEQIINYPEYLIIGAGQGNYERFSNGRYYGEIHSTLPSILFYYGVIPFLILLYWLYRNLKGLNIKQSSVYIAIFIESFTLINQRQLLLWVLIIIANLYKISNYNKVKEEECNV